VGLPDTETAVRVAPLLEPYGEPRIEADQIELTVDNGPKALVEILRRLDDVGVEPTTLAVREPSLDDVFLALTGRHATITDDEGGEA
jgi:ABC-2 type transport system ATP-binding protein